MLYQIYLNLTKEKNEGTSSWEVVKDRSERKGAVLLCEEGKEGIGPMKGSKPQREAGQGALWREQWVAVMERASQGASLPGNCCKSGRRDRSAKQLPDLCTHRSDKGQKAEQSAHSEVSRGSAGPGRRDPLS